LIVLFPLHFSFDTKTYELLRKQQDEQLKAKQLHQHQIWQHVQDRLAEQNKALEKESGKTTGKKVSSTKAVNGTSVAAASAVTKRSIKWNLEKNITKSKTATRCPLTPNL